MVNEKIKKKAKRNKNKKNKKETKMKKNKKETKTPAFFLYSETISLKMQKYFIMYFFHTKIFGTNY